MLLTWVLAWVKKCDELATVAGSGQHERLGFAKQRWNKVAAEERMHCPALWSEGPHEAGNRLMVAREAFNHRSVSDRGDRAGRSVSEAKALDRS